MILKGSQRGSGRELAAHLMRVDDNEHVRVHELRGFVSGDLPGAFQEVEAISRATKAKQPLFSLSLNPPADADVPVALFEQTIDRIEERLGLEDQPRAVVFHEKEGRRHAHCVWSRIDAETMTARPLPFFKNRLMSVSRDLYLEQGWEMPRGIANPANRNPTNFSLAEWQQAKRQGLDPRWLKSTVQGCWTISDDRRSFDRSLKEHGLFLAKGDRRGFAVLDHTGAVHSLPRVLDQKTKNVRARLGKGEDLPGVADTRKEIGKAMTPAIRRHVEDARERFLERSTKLGRYKQEMTRLHRAARTGLDQKLEAEWREETRERAARLPRGLKGLWHRITGKYQQARAENEAQARETRERQERERLALIQRQREQRAVLQEKFEELRKAQAARLLDLRKDIGRYIALSRGEEPGLGRTRGLSLGLKLQR